jgi:hypothetical protein
MRKGFSLTLCDILSLVQKPAESKTSKLSGLGIKSTTEKHFITYAKQED